MPRTCCSGTGGWRGSAPGIAGGVGAEVRVIDVRGAWVVPGLIDLHTSPARAGPGVQGGHRHRHPRGGGGRLHRRLRHAEHRIPPNDNRAVTELIVRRAREAGVVRVYPIGAISKGLKGEALAEMGEMKEAGIVAVSDDGQPVMNAELMRRAMEYARTFGLPVVQHCEDLTLSQGGAMNEGAVATRAGIRAQPPPPNRRWWRATSSCARLTGARYHVAHVSSAESVRAGARGQAARPARHLRGDAAPPDAHRRGVRRATTPTPSATRRCARPRTSRRCARRSPTGPSTPSRPTTRPHSPVEKEVEFEQAAFGMIGLETAVAAGAASWCGRGSLTPAALVALHEPRPGGRLRAARRVAGARGAAPTSR